MPKYVYRFEEGNKDQKDLLGGKGANLAEMNNLGLPVPPGFTITTDACRAYLRDGTVPEEMTVQVTKALREVEANVGRRLGAPEDPLLVSVRSGAKFSMPGMMETVLNVGLNDKSVLGLAAKSGNERFAWDSYRRLIQMFGKTVQDIDGDLFSDALDSMKHQRGTKADTDLTTEDLKELTEQFKAIVQRETGTPFPQEPRVQLDMAIEAVFRSWNSERARIYRRRERIPHELGTAVNIVTMVFGNMGEDSGTGVCFTRDPSSGRPGVYGDILMNAQGEDVVAGIRNTEALTDLEKHDKKSYDELLGIMRRLETHYQDMCDIEFTIERGKLWMLQVRVGKRTAGAAFRIASQLVDEGLITTDEALTRVTGEQLQNLMFPMFDASAKPAVFTKGMAASPGAAFGKIVFDNDAAEASEKAGVPCILVRRETNPDDLRGMVAANGVLTSRGGKTSHAAVVARGMGKTAVVGAENIAVDAVEKTATVGDKVLREGDEISIDGSTGEVFLGKVPVMDSPVTTYLSHGLEAALKMAADEDDIDLIKAVDRAMTHADRVRKLLVRTNADNPQDTRRALSFGAEGIGLCRTEHMFLGDRRPLVERLILSPEGSTERQAALDALEPLQKGDFKEMLQIMDGKHMTVRLIDPPLHEFLPDLLGLEVKEAVARAQGQELPEADTKMLQAVRRMHEANPMLGLRGVRLGIYLPGLFQMQMRALVQAACELKKEGKNPHPEIMVPLIGSTRELQIVRDEAEEVIKSVQAEYGVQFEVPVGCMIELPRAAMTAETIAKEADFFSFGTNDLTQTTWGFSRDDVEGVFFPQYVEAGIFGVSPFESIDVHGVGRVIAEGVARGRSTKPDLSMGICGEHGGDPLSIQFFHRVGVNYVSCSPFRVPVARLEAGRAAVAEKAGGDSSTDDFLKSV
ncbi:pyruvate, phosphate dikinase [Mobiluncus mulieris]|uniref:Pyruvate, phosphate dikinase n=1 Tax=Mobiluncus mulieris TaxID=2052 RepID=A0A2J9KNW5_9ACTO|nr:pyruvate, phosphate dikinase [Mobiluncus mulieris]EEJ53276.1 pyruvate, phosphate dikinase [Mobiluncus mulieris ATCC 35243]MBB5845236.1 pyruvate,orthophosphate dikinase [Mobiluncus mulieris]MCU9997154.1 pyruvate, phosphate dikinase [Mobiluncus mulieris]MCV0012478.1 pyruvate, phosphate dikinase [Mobiluncus mulieris]MCV0014610.1 pyruvate, phosphate dikinase [Mobiluncus mulieris]